MPAAATAKRGDISFDIPPAFAADQPLDGLKVIELIFADQADFRVNNFLQPLQQSSQHSHIITTKSGFVKIFRKAYGKFF
jgi:hypothetical protein